MPHKFSRSPNVVLFAYVSVKQEDFTVGFEKRGKYAVFETTKLRSAFL
jgi:hypothetical protein